MTMIRRLTTILAAAPLAWLAVAAPVHAAPPTNDNFASPLGANPAPGVPVVVLTGSDDEELGNRAVQSGAQDYLSKGQVDGHLLGRALRYAIERGRIEEELRRLRPEVHEQLTVFLATPIIRAVARIELLSTRQAQPGRASQERADSNTDRFP